MSVSQTTFRRAIFDPDAARPTGLADGQGRDAGRRFDVYRNNVTVSLREALEAAFPVVAKLVGTQNFIVLAMAYLRQNPPTSPLMMFYGQAMPDFVKAFAPTASIGYLPDIARLELALRESYHAADATPLDPGVLQITAPEALMAARVDLHPATRLIRSKWPIHAIWAFNSIPGAEKPTMVAQDTLVLRADLDPEPHLLPPGGGAFVAGLLAGDTFGAAIESAAASDATFDLSACLAILIANNALIALKD